MKLFSRGTPRLLYVTFSMRVMPMPWRMPPSAWTLVRFGFSGVPQSTQASYSTTRVSPVSGSISTSAAPAIKGGGEVGELFISVTSRTRLLKNMFFSAIFSRDTLRDADDAADDAAPPCSVPAGSASYTRLPSKKTSSFFTPSSSAPMVMILSLSFLAQRSTALPVT